jgi:hypothetical protein
VEKLGPELSGSIPSQDRRLTMPEKTADKIEPNGHPIPQMIEETTRRYTHEAERAAGDAFRIYNDFMTTTTNYYFDNLNRTMRQNVEIATYAQKTVEDLTGIYRRAYAEGYKSWEAYWQDINKVFTRK